MLFRKKTRWITALLIVSLGVSIAPRTAHADATAIAQPILVDGVLTDDNTYKSLDHLKSIKQLDDGAERLFDYANGVVVDLPAGSGYVLDMANSVIDTVLNNGRVRCTISREVMAEDVGDSDDSVADRMLTEGILQAASLDAVDNQATPPMMATVETSGAAGETAYKGNNSWQMLQWQDGDTYHFQGTVNLADTSDAYQVHLQSSAPITADDADLILNNFRVMDSTQLLTYLDFYPVADVKKIIAKDASTKQLVDYANGYTFTYPQDMTVDASQGDLRTVLKNNECQIEIYRQPLDQTVTASVYKTYSNFFLDNTVDHQLQYRGNRTISGMRAQVLQWQRAKLAKVANDKNYYLSVDLVRDKKTAYTVLFKSTRDIAQDERYLQVLRSFKLMKPVGHIAEGNFLETAKVTNETLKVATAQTAVANKAAKPTRYAQWNDETKALYDTYFSPTAKLTWGIFEPSAPESFYMLKPLEEKLDHQFKFLIQYQHLPSDNALTDLTTLLNNAQQEKRVVELTLQTTGISTETGNVVYDVLNGEYDELLNQYARKLSDFGHPVLFRLDNEMNGDWCQYSSYHTSKDTDMYKTLYRYIYDIFEKQGANKNVLWVWNPNEKSFPDFAWNNAAMYYPGNDVVDIVGMTGYNTGNYYVGETWRTFDQIYKPLYKDYTTRFDKPLMITEFGSNSVGGDKNQWVEQMFYTIKNMDKIKVAIWWSGCDWDSPGVPARIYYLDETPELLKIFKTQFNAGKVVPNKTVVK